MWFKMFAVILVIEIVWTGLRGTNSFVSGNTGQKPGLVTSTSK